MEKTYSSKVDSWLLIAMAVIVLISLATPFFIYRSAGFAALPSGMISLLIGAGVPIWIFSTTNYTLTDTTLFVTSGPFKWEVPVRDITGISSTRTALSSPALSLDRLRIDYGRRKSIVISPKNKQQFIADLEARRAKAIQSAL
jgi:hypothetical protein